MRVVAVGDNCVDHYTNLNLIFPGGGGVNFAVHAARAGAQSGYVGAVGADLNGEQIRGALKAEGVDVSRVQILDGPTAVAYVKIGNGDRTFIGSNPGVRYDLAMTDELREYITGADLVHTTLDGRMEQEVPRWKTAGCEVTFDFSHRSKPAQLALLPYVDIAFFSGQKIGPEGAEQAAREYHQLGARLVVITLGEHGSLAFDGRRFYRHPAEPITPLDTLGAGDSFMGTLAVTYLSGRPIEEAMAAGTRAAAAVCAHYGGIGHGADLK